MKKVLLINDSRFESMILADMFRQLDFEPVISDEFNALVELESFEPDLVVVNYIMEEIRGDKLIQIIKAGRPGVTCIMSSSNQLNKENFKARGCDARLRTPVSRFTWKDVLKRVDIGGSDSGAEEEGRFCIHCGSDISAFSEHILYCPFCGEEVD